MGAANFNKQKDFDLYAADFTDYTDDDYYFDEYAYSAASNKIDELNDTLRFFKLRLASGYYEGTQIIVDETDEYCDEHYLSSPYYDFKYHGVNRYILRRMINAERKRINTKLLPRMKDYGFEQYEISAKFSSGETWYKAV